VSAAEGRGEVVELADLRGGQLNAIGGSVLLDAGDLPGAGDRSDVVALGQQPGQGQLRRGDADLGGDYFDLVGDAQVVLEGVTDGQALRHDRRGDGCRGTPVVVTDRQRCRHYCRQLAHRRLIA
jgi:hypothetical protein